MARGNRRVGRFAKRAGCGWLTMNNTICLFLLVCCLAIGLIAYHTIVELYELIGAGGVLIVSAVATALCLLFLVKG